ncbi:MAG: META domain-containing protein [Anaerolineales bacterium]|jgi:heat shock protein HslJ
MKKTAFFVIVCATLLGTMLSACSTAESLDGTSWAMTSLRDSQGNLTDILPDTIVTANFQSDQVSGNVTCNNYSGTYQSTGNNIKIGPLATTLRECVGPDGIMEQEAAFLKAMEAAAQYEIKGDTLEMVDDQGDTILVFKRAIAE